MTLITPFFNSNEKSVSYSKTSNTHSITLQVREPRETLLGLQFSCSRPSSIGSGGWERLRVRHQDLLEEENFDVVLLESGKCSLV